MDSPAHLRGILDVGRIDEFILSHYLLGGDVAVWVALPLYLVIILFLIGRRAAGVLLLLRV